jgi:hypothetical protein
MLLGYTNVDDETKAELRALYLVWEEYMKVTPELFAQIKRNQEKNGTGYFARFKTMASVAKSFSEYLEISNCVNSNISVPMGERCTGRVVAVTNNGYMALAPKGTCIKDKVYLMAGANTPCIVREDTSLPSSSILSSTESRTRGRLVGEIYVHGLATNDRLITEGKFQEIELY